MHDERKAFVEVNVGWRSSGSATRGGSAGRAGRGRALWVMGMCLWLGAAQALRIAAAPRQSAPETQTKAACVPRFDPVVRQIEGWTVYIEPALLNGQYAKEGERALKMLANHLQRIEILM